jgi:hypothetical protein
LGNTGGRNTDIGIDMVSKASKANSDRMPTLTPEEYTFVTKILEGKSIIVASEETGISESSGYLWVKKPHISAAIAAGRQGSIKVFEEISAGVTRATVPEIAAKLQGEVLNAIDTVVELMNSGTKEDIVRLKSAELILKLSGQFIKQEVTTKTEVSIEKRGLSSDEASDIRRKILGVGAEAIDIESESIEVD